MHRSWIGIAALTGFAFAVSASAADGKGMFSVKSVGTANCQRYLDARAKGDREYPLFAGYLGGYLTAYNQLSPTTFDILPWQTVETVLGLMANYCNKNPDVNFAVAAARLIGVLAPDRLEAASESVDARTETAGVKLYRETLRRAQEKLRELGYYKGPADGQFGAATRRALEKFQAEKKIAKTGLPDQATLFHLLLAKPTT